MTARTELHERADWRTHRAMMGALRVGRYPRYVHRFNDNPEEAVPHPMEDK